MFELTGKVTLITGARRGMGAAHARAQAAAGADVVITDIDEAQCSPIAEEIRDMGRRALCYTLDVSDEADVEHVVTDVIRQWGHIDILINNAGIFEPTPASELTLEQWRRTIDINLTGQFRLAQRVAAEMRKNGGGRIINISSIASGQVGIGFTGAAHYAASKGGIIGMTETLALEWAGEGITVNAIAPGMIETPMISENVDEESKQALIAARIPAGRPGRPEEVAAAAVFLASDEASYVTGATLAVDGGWLAG